MDLFSNFCNICYENGSLKDISEENMKHLRNSLIIFVGHADIIEHNTIYLCQFCCEELARFDKFREMCLSNLIQLRQRYFNMKLELKDNACAVQNTLQKFVYDAGLQQSSLENSNCPISISTDCHASTESSADLTKDCSVFNRQVTNLQLETNKYDIDGACSGVSVTNSVTECDESRVAVTNEQNVKNEMLRHSEYIKLENFEEKADEDFVVSDTNNGKERDTYQMEFMKEEFDLKNERENCDSANFTRTNFENESDAHANFDVKVPVVNTSQGNVNSRNEYTKGEHIKQENSSENMKLGTTKDEFGDGEAVPFEFANVCSIVNMKDCGNKYIKSEEAESRGRNNILTTATSEPRTNHPHDLQSAAHNRIYPSVEAHTCVVCNKSFTTSSSFTRHARTHNDDRPYQCTVCNKSFTQSANLTTHERIHSGARPYKCTVCSKTFSQSGTLTAHEYIHSGVMPYKCTFCNKTFTRPSHLTIHERIHSGARPYRCTVCNKTFAQLPNLAIHERIHSGTRPYKCNVCNQTFVRLGNLTTHERIHSGARPYKCTVCNKTFARSSTLTIHERTHTGVRPYKCIVCNKTFKQSQSLSTHKCIHSDARP